MPDTPRTGSDSPATSRTIQLSVTGQQARIVPDEHDDGWVLEVGGHIQSHVDLTDPTRIRYEYLARMAALLRTSFPPGEPISIAHLGAGALTLPRFLQATRPGSEQLVIELERELTSLVTTELPLPAGTDLTVIVGDARTELAALAPRQFDAVVLDIYTGEGTVEHLTGQDFYTELLDRLTARGLLLINVGDDAGLSFFARQAHALERATAQAGMTGAWTLADHNLVRRRDTGNLVLAAGPALSARPPEETQSVLLAAGPHPAAVLTPPETIQFADELSG